MDKKRRIKSPNILFAIADDASHMGAYGHKYVKTPYFDRVATEGILFNNAFTTNPKCAPSRASILTGKHTWQLEEACTHFCVFPNKFKLYPDLLEEVGYHVGFTGKGWGPGDWKRNGLKRNPAGNDYSNITLTPIENTNICNVDYFENFKVFMSERKEDQPFYFWYGSREPHRPYIQGEGSRLDTTLDEVDVPSYIPNEEVVKSDYLDYASEINYFDEQLGKILNYLQEIGEYDNTLIIVTSDNGAPFPRIKGQMFEQDFNLPLAICWKERVKGGRVVDDLVSFIDFMPTFLDVAGIPIDEDLPGKSLMDILESKQDGIISKERKQIYMGKERHDLGRKDDKGYPVRCIRTDKFLYIRNFEPERWPVGNPETNFPNCDNSPTKSRILFNQHNSDDYYFNMCFGKRPMEELYDIQEDIECINNLSDKKNYQNIKQKLWNDLKNELKRTNDPRIFGKGDIFDTYEYVNETRCKHSWKKYINNKNIE
ncbi:MAG: sulfatase [Vallitalea sp.]|nr:sulfatase [Vallitalea sp.]